MRKRPTKRQARGPSYFVKNGVALHPTKGHRLDKPTKLERIVQSLKDRIKYQEKDR